MNNPDFLKNDKNDPKTHTYIPPPNQKTPKKEGADQTKGKMVKLLEKGGT